MRHRLSLAGFLVLAFSLLTGVAIAAAPGGRVELVDPYRTYDSRSSGTQQPVTWAYIGSGVFTVTAFHPTAVGSAVVHPCDEAAPSGESTFRLTDTKQVQYATFSTAEEVCLTATVPLHVIVDRRGTVSATPDPARSQYVALDQAVTVWDGPTTKEQQVVRIERPAALSADATAAVVSLEVLTSDAPGFLRVWDCDGNGPLNADVNYDRERAANVAYAAIDPGDDLCVFAFRPAHVRVRLLGELAPEGPNPALLPPAWRYVPGEVPAPSLRSIVPERVLDTREGVGRAGTSKVEADEVVELRFGDLVGPLTTAVVLNVTAVAPESPGHVTAWPCGGDRPVVSNLNFVAGETVPNLVVAKLGPGGTVCLSGTSRHHLVADLNGTFETDGGLLAQPISPERILDTRKAIGVPTTTKLAAGTTLELQVTGGTVPDGAGAATVNVTVAGPDAAGHVTVYPCDQPRPTASNLNFVAGQTVPNLVTAKLSADGTLCFHSVATTHLVADVGAWYGVDRSTGLIDLDPERFLDTRKAIGRAGTSKVPAGTFISVPIAGRGDVPVGAEAVVVNLTVTAPEGDGFVTAWPCDQSMSTVSNLNYVAGETNPNLATVKLAANGTLCLYTLATAHLVADVSGYLTDETVEGDEPVLE